MNLRLFLEYDGTDFHGWQFQPAQRTVQGVVEEALATILSEPVRLVGAGRTDAGVHALGQVAHVHTRSPLPPDAIGRALNGLLSPDVTVRSAEAAPEGFHARFDARSRRYRYTLALRRRSVGRQYAWFIPYRLSLGAMQRAASLFPGRRDFSSFCNTASERSGHVCEVTRCAWSATEDALTLDVAADRFLRGMVRTMVGTMVDAGRGRIPPDAVTHILDARDRRASCLTAPAHGLCLMGVDYPEKTCDS